MAECHEPRSPTSREGTVHGPAGLRKPTAIVCRRRDDDRTGYPPAITPKRSLQIDPALESGDRDVDVADDVPDSDDRHLVASRAFKHGFIRCGGDAIQHGAGGPAPHERAFDDKAVTEPLYGIPCGGAVRAERDVHVEPQYGRDSSPHIKRHEPAMAELHATDGRLRDVRRSCQVRLAPSQCEPFATDPSAHDRCKIRIHGSESGQRRLCGSQRLDVLAEKLSSHMHPVGTAPERRIAYPCRACGTTRFGGSRRGPAVGSGLADRALRIGRPVSACAASRTAPRRGRPGSARGRASARAWAGRRGSSG